MYFSLEDYNEFEDYKYDELKYKVKILNDENVSLSMHIDFLKKLLFDMNKNKKVEKTNKRKSI